MTTTRRTPSPAARHYDEPDANNEPPHCSPPSPAGDAKPRTNTAGSVDSTAQQIKRGLRAIWQPAGTYEAVVRTVDGKPRVYIRYVGEPT